MLNYYSVIFSLSRVVLMVISFYIFAVEYVFRFDDFRHPEVKVYASS